MATLIGNHLSITGLQDITHVMSKAEFEQIRASNRRLYAGAGFVEWGREASLSYPSVKHVNQGIRTQTAAGNENSFWMGNAVENDDQTKNSATSYPVVNVDGMLLKISATNTVYAENRIILEPACPGNETYDSATGAYVAHGSIALAFASETATNKVI